jgi:glycosyltransferase involved in cell wall biosynthesis
MVETVEDSLRSVLNRVDDRFEIVVVDGGSTDGTVDVLRSLAEEYGILRVIERDPDPDRHLGADRQHSIEACDGEYVLTQLDVDDEYEPVIRDFVEIYRTLESGIDGEFFLSATGLNVAPRSLLLKHPYRNLTSSEDRDLWRRLFAAGAIRWLDHRRVCRPLGYEPGLRARIRRDMDNKRADARVGLAFDSCLRWSVAHERHGILERERGLVGRLAKSAYDLLTYPVAYWQARGTERFETPAAFRRRGQLERAIATHQKPLADHEAELGVKMDREALSERGRELLCVGGNGVPTAGWP